MLLSKGYLWFAFLARISWCFIGLSVIVAFLAVIAAVRNHHHKPPVEERKDDDEFSKAA